MSESAWFDDLSRLLARSMPRRQAAKLIATSVAAVATSSRWSATRAAAAAAKTCCADGLKFEAFDEKKHVLPCPPGACGARVLRPFTVSVPEGSDCSGLDLRFTVGTQQGSTCVPPEKFTPILGTCSIGAGNRVAACRPDSGGAGPSAVFFCAAPNQLAKVPCKQTFEAEYRLGGKVVARYTVTFDVQNCNGPAKVTVSATENRAMCAEGETCCGAACCGKDQICCPQVGSQAGNACCPKKERCCGASVCCDDGDVCCPPTSTSGRGVCCADAKCCRVRGGCCPRGQECQPGKGCVTKKVCLPCAPNEVCTDAGCCPSGRACFDNAVCCADDALCVGLVNPAGSLFPGFTTATPFDQSCCPRPWACRANTYCCPPGQVCLNDAECCPASQVCLGGRACCPPGLLCVNDRCVPPIPPSGA